MECRALEERNRKKKGEKDLFESQFFLWLTHVNVWYKSTQYFNEIIIIKKKMNEPKKKKKWDLTTFLAKTQTTQSRHVQ